MFVACILFLLSDILFIYFCLFIYLFVYIYIYVHIYDYNIYIYFYRVGQKPDHFKSV